MGFREISVYSSVKLVLLVILGILLNQQVSAVDPLKKLRGISWFNCGSVTDPIQLVNLRVTPDRIHLPGDINLTAEVMVAFNVSSPVKVELELKRKTVFGWLNIPCLDKIGSCKYEDACALSPYRSLCPEIFKDHSIPCHCPIDQGTYKVDDWPISISDQVKIPRWLEKGKYKGRVTAFESEHMLACYEFQTELS